MKTKKLIPIVLSLGIGAITLSGCSTQTTNNSANDKFYDDATNVLQIVQSDLESNKTTLTTDQLKTVNSFINNYANLPVTSKEFKDYMDTINQVEQFTNLNDTSTSTTVSKVSVSDKPAPGMTAAEVKASKWGIPSSINKTTTKSGISEQWVYNDFEGRTTGYVYLDNGIVTSVQEMD